MAPLKHGEEGGQRGGASGTQGQDRNNTEPRGPGLSSVTQEGGIGAVVS